MSTAAQPTTTDTPHTDPSDLREMTNSPSGRLLVQRTLFTGPDTRIEPGIYADTDLSRVRLDRRRAHLGPGARLSANTYFGRFPAAFWQSYTRVRSVRLEFDHDCAPGTTLRIDIRASDISGRERPVQTAEVSGQGHVSFDLDVKRFIDGGAIWFELTAIDGPASISGVEWSVDSRVRDRPVSVVMCTHNRPADAVATVLALASDPVVLERVAAVYVVDQGTDRVADQARFSEVTAVLGDRLHYITQPNLGGAGGFNRGIHEVTKGGSHDTDIVVMDDDITCEPESILRLTSFANSTARPMLVGSQMLLASETYRVHMTGEWEALDELKAGRPGAYGKQGLNALEKQQDARTDAGWNGWWSCLLPVEAVYAAGLSLPLFFQWDDIEFGIRARRNGFPTATLPNAGVWHADFHLKDYDDWSRYFSWRNALIVAAIHGPYDPKHLATVIAKEVGAHIVSMRYGLAATFLLAVRDFLRGPSILDDGGMSKLSELKELRAQYPDTVIRDSADVFVDADPNTRISRRGPLPDEDKETRVLVKRAVQQWLGRVSPAPVSISADDGRWWHVGLFSSAIVTDSSQTGVRVRRRDKQIAVRLGRELAQLCLELRRDGLDVAEQWRGAMPELTSRENWTRLFDGD
ncbi:glycosyltransferase [Gordonia jacobaea]|uniref:glycosyltransferase n=1 Tax=Gordonia jacobaea TaxID=122202 RepID=UPI003D707DCF